jgi:hypothetical protein
MTELRGLDKELYDKRMSKHDPQREEEAISYIETVSGLSIERTKIQNSLKSGFILASMINNIIAARGLSDIKPIKLNNSKMAFKQMEQIGLSLERIKLLGVKSQETFQTVDLYEGKNMQQVNYHN